MATARTSTSKKPAAAAKSVPARKGAKSSTSQTAKSSSSRAAAAKTASTAKPARPQAKKAVAKTPARAATKKPSRPTRLESKSPAKSSAQRTAMRKAGRARQKEENHIDRVWQLAERIGICMFITWDGERQRARPLAAHVKRDEHALYFLTDIKGHKDEQIARFPTVSLAFADPKRVHYLAITGQASMSNDRGKIKELWNPWAKAWWDSADDPDIRVIRVSPDDAELWDSPGRVAATFAMLSAVVTGKSPKLMDNAKVNI